MFVNKTGHFRAYFIWPLKSAPSADAPAGLSWIFLVDYLFMLISSVESNAQNASRHQITSIFISVWRNTNQLVEEVPIFSQGFQIFSRSFCHGRKLSIVPIFKNDLCTDCSNHRVARLNPKLSRLLNGKTTCSFLLILLILVHRMVVNAQLCLNGWHPCHNNLRADRHVAQICTDKSGTDHC